MPLTNIGFKNETKQKQNKFFKLLLFRCIEPYEKRNGTKIDKPGAPYDTCAKKRQSG